MMLISALYVLFSPRYLSQQRKENEGAGRNRKGGQGKLKGVKREEEKGKQNHFLC